MHVLFALGLQHVSLMNLYEDMFFSAHNCWAWQKVLRKQTKSLPFRSLIIFKTEVNLTNIFLSLYCSGGGQCGKGKSPR